MEQNFEAGRAAASRDLTAGPAVGSCGPTGPGVLSRLASRAAVGALALLVTAGPALAQAQQLLPPENKEGIKGKAFISGFVAILLLALVLVGAFLKTKRGHQD